MLSVANGYIQASTGKPYRFTTAALYFRTRLNTPKKPAAYHFTKRQFSPSRKPLKKLHPRIFSQPQSSHGYPQRETSAPQNITHLPLPESQNPSSPPQPPSAPQPPNPPIHTPTAYLSARRGSYFQARV